MNDSGVVREPSFSDVRFVNSRAYGLHRCMPDWNWRPAPMTDYDVWYALSGKGAIMVNDGPYPVSGGSLFVFRPGDRVIGTHDADRPLTVIYIHLHVVPAQRSAGKDKVADALPVPEQSPALSLVPRFLKVTDTIEVEPVLYRMLESGDRSERWEADEFDSLARLLFIHLARQQSDDSDGHGRRARHSRLVRKAIIAIRGEGAAMTHARLAELTGLSPPYLNKLFKRYTGTTLQQYMTRVKMERALHLLGETTMNVTEAAHALGFADVFSFSKRFRAYFGYPPSRLK